MPEQKIYHLLIHILSEQIYLLALPTQEIGYYKYPEISYYKCKFTLNAKSLFEIKYS